MIHYVYSFAMEESSDKFRYLKMHWISYNYFCNEQAGFYFYHNSSHKKSCQFSGNHASIQGSMFVLFFLLMNYFSSSWWRDWSGPTHNHIMGSMLVFWIHSSVYSWSMEPLRSPIVFSTRWIRLRSKKPDFYGNNIAILPISASMLAFWMQSSQDP